MMTATAIAGLALLAGRPVWVAIAAFTIAVAPVMIVPAGAVLAVVAWRRRRKAEPTAEDEAAFLRAVASGLSAGASLRTAVSDGADRCERLDLRRVVRLCRAGMPADQISSALGGALPMTGRLVGPAVELAARSGGTTVELFHSLAVLASEHLRLEREAAAGTAGARASALLVAGLPVVAIIGLVGAGRVDPGSDPGVGMVVAVGLGLQAIGVGVMWSMLRGTVARTRAEGAM